MIAIFVLIMVIIIIDLSSRKDKDSHMFPLQKPKQDEYGLNILTEEIETKIEQEPVSLDMVAEKTILDEIDVNTVTKSLEKTAEIEEIKYVEEDEELEKTKARIELQTLKEELSKMEENEYIEEIPKPTLIPQVDLPVKEDITDTFEDEQEENAIISVEELTKKSMEISDSEIEQYEDDGNEPISITELEEMYKEKEKIELPDFDIRVDKNELEEPKKFKNTPFISPVFGLREEEKNEIDIVLEQTADLDEVNEEIRKTNEFLSILRELRKNL